MKLSIIPTKQMLVLGCVDPRVDPLHVLGLELGDAAVLRNIGGRVNPEIFDTLELLATVARGAGHPIEEGWKLVVLHHTDCGIIGCNRHAPAALAHYLGVAEAEMPKLAIASPRESVVLDVAALRADPRVPKGFAISGLVYDVVTEKVETVVP